MKPCIVLIGIQHVGKTTLGKALADKLGIPFFDTDLEIKRVFGRHPRYFTIDGGQAAYNRVESAITLWLHEKFKEAEAFSAVISTGSGFCDDREGQKDLRDIGVFYDLDAGFAAGAQRILDEAVVNPDGSLSNIPSYAVHDNAKTLEDVRKSFYKTFAPKLKLYEELADVIIKLDKNSVEENVSLILENIRSPVSKTA